MFSVKSLAKIAVLSCGLCVFAPQIHAQNAPEKPRIAVEKSVQLQVEIWTLSPLDFLGKQEAMDALARKELMREESARKYENPYVKKPLGAATEFLIVESNALESAQQKAAIQTLSVPESSRGNWDFLVPELTENRLSSAQNRFNFGPRPEIRNFFDPNHGAVPINPQLRAGALPPQFAFRLKQSETTQRLQSLWPPEFDFDARTELKRGQTLLVLLPDAMAGRAVNLSKVLPNQFAPRNRSFLLLRAL